MCIVLLGLDKLDLVVIRQYMNEKSKERRLQREEFPERKEAVIRKILLKS